MSSASPIGATFDVPDLHFDEITDTIPTQAISGRNINRTKLMTMLRTKFGVGAYDVSVRSYHLSESTRLTFKTVMMLTLIQILRDSYCIVAPRKLSISEIAECKRR